MNLVCGTCVKEPCLKTLSCLACDAKHAAPNQGWPESTPRKQKSKQSVIKHRLWFFQHLRYLFKSLNPWGWAGGQLAEGQGASLQSFPPSSPQVPAVFGTGEERREERLEATSVFASANRLPGIQSFELFPRKGTGS